MIGSCPVPGEGAGVVERLAAYLDCQSAQIDLAAFQGGLWHGLPGALVSVLLVLYVAAIGYRMILHRRLDVASLVYAAARLGVVIAVATTFSAYSSLVYTVATRGPVELAAMALAPTGLRVAPPTEAGRAATDELDVLAQSLAPASPAAAPPGDPGPSRAAPPDTSKGLGAAVFLISCVGFSLAARLAQAIVLASGPLFIATALFDMSTGLFVGWLRALAALFVAQAGYAVSAALELSFFAQDLQRLPLSAADAGEPLLVGAVFLVVGIAITVVAILAGGGLPRPALRGRLVPGPEPRTAPGVIHAPPSRHAGELRVDNSVSRAQRITDAVGALAAADEQRLAPSVRATGAPRAVTASGAMYEPFASAGPGLRRPGQLRPSSGASRRDSIS